MGLGLHADTPNRDSCALDVLEPVRPQLEDWVLGWIMREPFRRADFFEMPNGNCRLMSRLCVKLSETAPVWGRLVAPWVEYVARTLWAATSPSKSVNKFPTHLTQEHRKAAKGNLESVGPLTPRPEKVCKGCGVILASRQKAHCALCGIEVSRTNMTDIAHRGRAASRSAESRAGMSASQKRQRLARGGWSPSSLPPWLTQSTYKERIWPRLCSVTVPTLAQTLKVSEPYAAKVRKGQYVPHPMHWEALAELAGVSTS